MTIKGAFNFLWDTAINTATLTAAAGIFRYADPRATAVAVIASAVAERTFQSIIAPRLPAGTTVEDLEGVVAYSGLSGLVFEVGSFASKTGGGTLAGMLIDENFSYMKMSVYFFLVDSVLKLSYSLLNRCCPPSVPADEPEDSDFEDQDIQADQL